METVTTVEVTRKDDFPRAENCFFIVNLKIGLNVWLVFESIIWLILFIAALCYECIYINENDLLSFIDETEDWYSYLIFGDRFYYLDQRIRTYIILINFLLMMIFLTYLLFCLILLWGINMSRICGFIPYIAFDAIFIILAVCGCIVGFAASIIHLFRVSFIFLVIKTYVEFCVISYFREVRFKAKSTETSENASVLNEEVSTTAV